MNPITPNLEYGGELVIYAKDQPEYTPLPAIKFEDGRIVTEWKLTDEERRLISLGENIRLHIYTFHCPLQPIALEVTSEHQ